MHTHLSVHGELKIRSSPGKQDLNVSVRLGELTWRELWPRCCINPKLNCYKLLGVASLR